MAATITYTVAGGEMLSQKKGGADYDYLPNPLGSVKRTIANGQSLRQQYLYSPWGESDPVSDDENASTPFQFIGAYGGRTQDVGGVYFRARTYSPTNARWLTVDPLWPDESAFSYCLDSPVSAVDPSGLACNPQFSLTLETTDCSCKDCGRYPHFCTWIWCGCPCTLRHQFVFTTTFRTGLGCKRCMFFQWVKTAPSHYWIPDTSDEVGWPYARGTFMDDHPEWSFYLCPCEAGATRNLDFTTCFCCETFSCRCVRWHVSQNAFGCEQPSCSHTGPVWLRGAEGSLWSKRASKAWHDCNWPPFMPCMGSAYHD